MKTCPVCNKNYGNTDDAFCMECGVLLIDDTYPGSSIQQKGKDKKIPLIAVLIPVLVVVVIGIIIIAVTAANKKDNKNNDNVAIAVTQESSTQENTTEKPYEGTTVVETLTAKETTTSPSETTAATIQGNMLTSMSDTEHEAVNTFLSNFAEVRFGEYNAENFDPAQLIDFAILHGCINNNSSIIINGTEVSIHIEDAARYISRFFGKTVTFTDTYLVDYDRVSQMLVTSLNDVHTCCLETVDSEYYLHFATAYRVSDNGDGTYSVDFYISAQNFEDEARYYSYSYDELLKMSNIRNVGSGSAVFSVEDNKLDDSFSYQLLKYNVKYN